MEHKPFDQETCDTLYHIACATDCNCADDCDFDCPYQIDNGNKDT